MRNVEAIGGRVTIIINNEEGQQKLTMLDDGTGNDLTIPGVLISKEDGDLIRNFIKNNKNHTELLEQMVLEINFEMVMEIFIIKGN